VKVLDLTAPGGGGAAGKIATVVQAKSLRTAGTMTFDAATTIGNMILVVWTGGNGPTAAPAGTNALFNYVSVGGEIMGAFIKPADGTTMATVCASGDNGQWAMYEIANYGGAIPFNVGIAGGVGARAICPAGPGGSVCLFAIHNDSGNDITFVPGAGEVLDGNGSGGGNHKALWGHTTDGLVHDLTFTSVDATVYFGTIAIYPTG